MKFHDVARPIADGIGAGSPPPRPTQGYWYVVASDKGTPPVSAAAAKASRVAGKP
jgi:hypothetical protein